jgi:hypothetical protein
MPQGSAALRLVATLRRFHDDVADDRWPFMLRSPKCLSFDEPERLKIVGAPQCPRVCFKIVYAGKVL